MKSFNHDVDAIMLALDMDDDHIAQRQHYLSLMDNDKLLLKNIHALLLEKHGFLSDKFYAHLVHFPDQHIFMEDAAGLTSLKHAQATYFSSLTTGVYDEMYVRNVVSVGVMHQSIGLDYTWYVSAYRHYLYEMVPILWTFLGKETDIFFATYNALLKVVSFDMSLVFDMYSNTEQQHVIRQKKYTEHIFSCLPNGVLVLDAALCVCSMNPVMRTVLGIAPSAVVEGRYLPSLLASPVLYIAAQEVLDSGVTQHRLSLLDAAHPPHYYHWQFSLARTWLEGMPLLLLTCHDDAFISGMEAELKESEERFRLSFLHAAVGMAHLTADSRLLRVNIKLQEVLGYSEKELLCMTLKDVTHPDDVAADIELQKKVLAGELQDYAREKRYLHKDGRCIWVNVTISSMVSLGGNFRFIAMVEDISKRKAVEKEMLHLASHDVLTDLPNRTLLQDRLSQAIIQAQRARKYVAVMFVDLDRFKNINDSLGHDLGDQVIREAGRRLANALRTGDTVARHGGDEFVIVLNEINRQSDVLTVVQKIISTIAAPMVLQGHELYLTSSVGISMYPRDGRDSMALLKNADTAMYQAKQAGGDGYKFYVDEMNKRTLAMLKMEGALRHALEREEFILYYQPQINIDSGRIVGFEALIRWLPPGAALISPDEFIPIAEETGLIVSIGEWVLASACAQAKIWCDNGWGDQLKVSVNLSARQFRQHNLVESIRDILYKTGCHADKLVLEITESVVMDKPEAAAEVLRQLSAMGVQLAIDDFGTGYSSLAYLKRFPIHTLKIDRSFIGDITEDNDDAEIVKAVIALAHAMNRHIVAAGVETDGQLAFLRQYGCDQAQGYYFGRPLPVEQATQLLYLQQLADKEVMQMM